MQARSSVNPVTDPQWLSSRARSADLTPSQRAGLLALNLIPVLHVAAIVVLAALPYASWRWRVGAVAGVIYLLPPLAAKLVRLMIAIPEGRIAMGTKEFFGWWALFQLQTLFCRLPALEELLRLVPGVYSGWLRLWGARIGRLSYWAPGTLILDRSFLQIGDEVVFGAGVRVSPHVLIKDVRGELEVLLGTVKIGDHAILGGYSLLTAGTEIASNEATRAFLISPPFSLWSNGRRIRRGREDAVAHCSIRSGSSEEDQ